MPVHKQYWFTTGPWFLFTAGAISGLCLQLYYYKFIDNDTLSYINIAELYAEGRWHDAINGYWSPFYSWLIALFIKCHVQPHITCYCINLVAAAACFYFAGRAGRRYLTNPLFCLLYQLCIIAGLLFYAMSDLTPDLPATAFLCWFLTLLSAPRSGDSSRLWVLTAVAAALSFLAKSYNFLFVNLLFMLLLAAQLWFAGKRRERHYRSTIYSFLLFWAISLAWIIPLSLHENKPVFSTAGGYSHSFVHPAHPDHAITREIIPPPFEGAYTGWLNPAHQLDHYAWSPFSSAANARYQLGLIIKNAIRAYRIPDYFYIKGILLLVAIGVLAWYDKNRLKAACSTVQPWLLVLLLYPLAYLPFFIIERYIYIEGLLFYLLFFYLLQETVSVLPVGARRALLFALLLVVMTTPFLMVQRAGFVRQKIADYRYYRSLHTAEPGLQFLANKRIVTDRIEYVVATQLCYRLPARLYGVWSPAQQYRVQQYKIEYLLSATARQEVFLQLSAQVHLEKGTLYVYRFMD